MALNQTFTDALMNLRRKAQLQGRPLTQAETSGVVAGMAESASDRLARNKALEQRDTELSIKGSLAEQQRQMYDQMLGIANKSMRSERMKNYITTGLTAPKMINESYQAGKQLYGSVAPAVSKLFSSGAAPAATSVLQTQAASAAAEGGTAIPTWGSDIAKLLTDYGF